MLPRHVRLFLRYPQENAPVRAQMPIFFIFLLHIFQSLLFDRLSPAGALRRRGASAFRGS
jgi:hypothetical protein